MARIKPFKGIRPPKDLIEQVASRPYDVLNSEEAREEAKGNEKSLYHIIKPEIDFPVGTDEHDPAVYLKAAANFRMFQEKGWLVQDKEECYYVYAQTMNGKTQYGLVVGAYVPDYMNGVIKKHELTRRDKEEDRMKHVRVNNANIEPVFFAYPDNAELDQIVAKYTSRNPEYDFVAKDDGFGHTFWIIDEPADIARITELFGEMPSLYIASGTIVYRDAAGRERNIHALPEGEKRRLLRSELGFVHQRPSDGLRMQVSAGANIGERLMAEGARHYGTLRGRALQWLERVEIDAGRIDDKPALYSGGMQQRLQIARNLVTSPRLVFMDEPTGGLDVSVQARLLDLLRHLVLDMDLAVILVTHDLAVARLLSHRLMVMYRGEVVETGLTDQVLDDPHHAYTQLLVSSILQG